MKHLLPYISAVIFSMCLLQMSGCKKEDTDGIKQTSFNTAFDLQLAGKIIVHSADRQIMVELRSLNDTRCSTSPCEQTGDAHVRVFLSDTHNKANAETNLCLGNCDESNKTSDTASIALNGVNYKLVLKNISGTSVKKAELKLDII